MSLVIAIFVAAWIWISTSKILKYCHNATAKCKLRCIVITRTLILAHMLSIWQNSFPFPWPKFECFIFKSLVSLQHVTCIKAFWKIVSFSLSFIWLILTFPQEGTKKFSCPGVPLSQGKGRNKNPGTNSSVLGQNKFLFI